jgi:hypothetical protein
MLFGSQPSDFTSQQLFVIVWSLQHELLISTLCLESKANTEYPTLATTTNKETNSTKILKLFFSI